jgi:tetratricopeptide (TPR) repeat protein
MKYFVLPLLVSCSVLFGQQNSKSLEDRADSFWNDFADLSGARDSSTSLVFPDSLSVDKLIIPLDSAERLYLAAYHTESSEDCLAYAIECVENMYNLFRSEAREREFLRYTDRLSRNYHPFSTYPSIGSMIGSSHLAIGETHTARQIFENILKNINSQRHLDSKIGVIYNELGILARKRGDFGAAIEIYENVVDLFQANLKQDSSVLIDLQNVYNNLAVSYGKIDRYDLAISLLKQQIENPYFSTMDSITTATNLADNYSKAGRHQAAIEAFEQLSEQYARHSRSPLLFLRYGEACSRAQQEEKALEMFQKALLATHTFDASDSYFFSRIYKPMGDSYVSLGKIKQALSSYHKPLSYISSTFSDAPLAQNPAKATMRVEPLTVFLLAQKANAMSVMSGTYSFSEIMDGFLKADSMLVLLRRNQEHDDSKLITSEQTHHLYGNALAVCLRQFQNGDEQGLHLAWYFMERHRANLFWEQLQEQDAFGSLPPDNPLRKEKVRLQEAIRKLKRL